MDELRESIIFCAPVGIHDAVVKALKTAASGEEKMVALSTLLKVCTVEGNFLEGWSAINRLIDEAEMSTHRSRLLFWAGEMSEGLCDFDGAIGYYCRSLACAQRPQDLCPAILTNLGFCWLYKQEFKSAEESSRRALALAPKSWEAWKNLGVSLEHQSRIQEAFVAYFKAVFLGRGRVVPVNHLVRISQRHPSILPDVANLQPDLYREYSFVFLLNQ